MLHPIGISTPQPKPKPKFEYRNRAQVYFGPVDLEALVPASHPARAVWDLIETLDFARYEDLILSREGQAGRSAAPPRLLAALWIYGYSLGVGSARALERMQTHEPGLRGLCAPGAVLWEDGARAGAAGGPGAGECGDAGVFGADGGRGRPAGVQAAEPVW